MTCGAEEVKIIDVEPEVLMKRLKEGKIYKAVQAERQFGEFFRKGKVDLVKRNRTQTNRRPGEPDCNRGAAVEFG